VTGAGLAAVPVVDDTVEFGHVLAGVGLTGSAARLAELLEARFLTEAGWDPATRVLSLPAAHPFLGRTLCRVGGCPATAHSGPTGGACWRCFTRLSGLGLSEQQIASSLELALLPARPDGCAVVGCQRMSPAPRSVLCAPHSRRLGRKSGTSLEQFLSDPLVLPLPPLGPCHVAACTRRRALRSFPWVRCGLDSPVGGRIGPCATPSCTVICWDW